MKSKELLVKNKAEEQKMIFTLFKDSPKENKEIIWNWILKEFQEKVETTYSQPKAVILIEFMDRLYAITFGSAFFYINRFANREFAFNFIRRVPLNAIKSTSLNMPNSQLNKGVFSYNNYETLDYESGQSFMKIKATVDFSKLKEAEELYRETLEIGSSIKFNIINPSLESIKKLILHTEKVSKHTELQKIPLFYEVKDPNILKRLDDDFKKVSKKYRQQMNISEFDIIGTSEIFNQSDTYFKFRHGRNSKRLESLTIQELEAFAKVKQINLDEEFLNVKIEKFVNNQRVLVNTMKELIDFTHDELKCVLINGKWHQFNDDYINYLHESLSEIALIYEHQFDFTKDKHKRFIDEKFCIYEKKNDYKSLPEQELKKKLSNLYYAERVFNIIAQENGFELYDRDSTHIQKHKVEILDLYDPKEETIFAVKIGSQAATLNYVVDQSLISLRVLDLPEVEAQKKFPIKKVGIWIVLERKSPLPTDEHGNIQLKDLSILSLKNKLDQWKKDVRLKGYEPVIRINYRNLNKKVIS